MNKEKIKSQIIAIRDTGLTNMFDIHKVQRLAYDREFYELVSFIEESPSAYAHFIFTGKFKDKNTKIQS